MSIKDIVASIDDEDFNGLGAAADKFDKLVEDAQANGFQPITFWDQIDYEEKLRASKH